MVEASGTMGALTRTLMGVPPGVTKGSMPPVWWYTLNGALMGFSGAVFSCWMKISPNWGSSAWMTDSTVVEMSKS